MNYFLVSYIIEGNRLETVLSTPKNGVDKSVLEKLNFETLVAVEEISKTMAEVITKIKEDSIKKETKVVENTSLVDSMNREIIDLKNKLEELEQQKIDIKDVYEKIKTELDNINSRSAKFR